MFHSAEAQMANPLGLVSLKRGRDDSLSESCNAALMGFTEHRNKRIQTLPLRTSPRSAFGRNTSEAQGPQSLGFAAGAEEQQGAAFLASSYAQQAAYAQPQEGNAYSHFSPWSSTPTADADMDMMMDGDAPSGSADHGDGSNGRIPTPILPSFVAQVKGNNWSGGPGNCTHVNQHSDGADTFATSPASAFPNNATAVNGSPTPPRDRTVPRSLEHPSASGVADWSVVQNRPLPSPISENGCEEVNSPDMVLDGQGNVYPYMPSRASSATELPVYLRSDSPALPCSPPQEHPNLQQYQQPHQQREGSPSPGKKGHTRSRHTVNNWTLHAGMKKSFSIGYRSDCEKCRLKVPGHFNHIIVS